MQTYEERIGPFKSQMLSRDSVPLDLCDLLKEKIVNLEDTILNLGPSNYKETPENTITTRHQYYNLLDYIGNDMPVVKEKIIDNCRKVLGGDHFYIKMWANIFRHGDNIKKHIHHATPIIENEMFKRNVFKTLSGNLFLYGDKDSETVYYFKEKTPVKNVVGEIGRAHV